MGASVQKVGRGQGDKGQMGLLHSNKIATLGDATLNLFLTV